MIRLTLMMCEMSLDTCPFVMPSDAVLLGDNLDNSPSCAVLAGWSRQTILTRAASFAASICGVRGAVPAAADFYDDFL